jgi:hypothetical protein
VLPGCDGIVGDLLTAAGVPTPAATGAPEAEIAKVTMRGSTNATLLVFKKYFLLFMG